MRYFIDGDELDEAAARRRLDDSAMFTGVSPRELDALWTLAQDDSSDGEDARDQLFDLANIEVVP